MLAQADTGTGKTVVLADAAKREKYIIVVAHRNILIRQASLTLAKHGIIHGSGCSEHTRRMCLLEQRRVLGKEMLRKDAIAEASTHASYRVVERLTAELEAAHPSDTQTDWDWAGFAANGAQSVLRAS
ncbi:hypothetical protein [Mesorhizobium sp. B2-4-17]|uniref:hypothetical protein n=1 Tax=Mesorhizobium sp. B2-4-17 TaxID=2589932 RepID=UPI00112A77DD|nr:hypothetical protein [Mesorhizobium sp. B2-4-17]TPK91485.1 hypothetical protein FJ548_04395 [Mesorhizobium sp. B2-4-17]